MAQSATRNRIEGTGYGIRVVFPTQVLDEVWRHIQDSGGSLFVGGILLGLYTERAREIYAAEAPPGDSVSTADRWERGTRGVMARVRAAQQRSLQYIGEWVYCPHNDRLMAVSSSDLVDAYSRGRFSRGDDVILALSPRCVRVVRATHETVTEHEVTILRDGAPRC